MTLKDKVKQFFSFKRSITVFTESTPAEIRARFRKKVDYSLLEDDQFTIVSNGSKLEGVFIGDHFSLRGKRVIFFHKWKDIKVEGTITETNNCNKVYYTISYRKLNEIIIKFCNVFLVICVIALLVADHFLYHNAIIPGIFFILFNILFFQQKNEDFNQIEKLLLEIIKN